MGQIVFVLSPRAATHQDAFNAVPEPTFWRKLFQPTPEHFRFVFKVPEQITRQAFPAHVRYGTAAR